MASELHLCGALTAQEQPELQAQLLHALQAARMLRIHLWAVQQVDAAGVAALQAVQQAAAVVGKTVQLVDASPAVQRALQAHGVSLPPS